MAGACAWCCNPVHSRDKHDWQQAHRHTSKAVNNHMGFMRRAIGAPAAAVACGEAWGGRTHALKVEPACKKGAARNVRLEDAPRGMPAALEGARSRGDARSEGAQEPEGLAAVHALVKLYGSGRAAREGYEAGDRELEA